MSVKLVINGINHQYLSQCGNVGSSLMNNSHEFSCILKSFNDFKEVEFVVIGYNASINDKWSTIIRVTIAHYCTEGTYNYSMLLLQFLFD